MPNARWSCSSKWRARVAADACDEYPAPVARPRISLRTRRVNAVLGTTLDAEDVWDALAPLGIELDDAVEAHADADADADADGNTVLATPPSWRPDLEREIDLVEEVARRIGFDAIGRTLPDSHGQVGALTVRQQERRAVADALVGLGVSEAITLSLVAPADLERSGAPVDRMVRASNPLRAEESVLRTAILPGLLRAVAANHAHGLLDVALFEQGRVFAAPVADGGPLPDEPEHVAVALSGTVRRAPVEPDRARRLRRGRRGTGDRRCARGRRGHARARRGARVPPRSGCARGRQRCRRRCRRRDCPGCARRGRPHRSGGRGRARARRVVRRPAP